MKTQPVFQTSTLKEMLRSNTGWTDVLDPGGKPYLVLDQNSGKFYILYWKAWFSPFGPWLSSSWYEEPPESPRERMQLKANSWPKESRVWELPTVEYAPPKNYTHVPINPNPNPKEPDAKKSRKRVAQRR